MRWAWGSKPNARARSIVSEPLPRYANRFSQIIEKNRGLSTIDHSMITRECKGHRWTDTGLTIHRYHPIGNAPNCQAGGLRECDDGVESIDAVHAQVGNSEGSGSQIRGPQTSASGSLGQVSSLQRDVGERRDVRVENYGS